MSKGDDVYVGHMLETARKIGSRAQRLDRAEFDADEDVRLALAHLVQILGEAASRVSQAFCDEHPEVPWREIVGMRNKIVHDYMGLDFDVVWQVVAEDIAPLRDALERMVGQE
jgi:uncharacterized protein with HEPN domain